MTDRYYIKRMPKHASSIDEVIEVLRDSNLMQIIDSMGVVESFTCDENDADYICDALNEKADRS